MKIYLVTNNCNEKLYVGQTVKPLNLRWNEHNSNRGCPVFRRAIKKYGKQNFKMEVIHECLSKEEMDFVEIFYIAFLNTKVPNGYNITDGGGGILGLKHSEETKKKISEKNKGHVMSDEQKAQISAFHKGRKHVTPTSEEERQGLRERMTGVVKSQETRDKLRKAHLGKKRPPFSEETKKKMSDSRRARPLRPEAEQPKGIFWREHRNKWEVRIRINGKPTYLGRYPEREQAENVWDEAFIKYFGNVVTQKE